MRYSSAVRLQYRTVTSGAVRCGTAVRYLFGTISAVTVHKYVMWYGYSAARYGTVVTVQVRYGEIWHV